MKVGDLIRDITINSYGVIIAEDITWVDERSGNCSYWDYEIMYVEGDFGYADHDELEIVNENR